MALRAKRNARSFTIITALDGVNTHGDRRLNSAVLQGSEQTPKRMAKGMTWILEPKFFSKEGN